jgi:hypothetical protein
MLSILIKTKEKVKINTTSIKDGYVKLSSYLSNHCIQSIVDLITFNNENMADTDDAWDTFNTIFRLTFISTMERATGLMMTILCRLLPWGLGGVDME